MRRRFFSSLLPRVVLAMILVSPLVRADEGDTGPALRAPRFGVTPGIGAGVAVLTAQPSAFPSFVGTSVLHAEVFLELARWGFFVRGAYLSSGQSGRWTAPEAAFGGQYRLLGDGEVDWGVTVRLGVVYARWQAASAGCDIAFVIPQNCQYYVAPPAGAGGTTTTTPTPPVLTTTADTIGPLAALRLEVPLVAAYIAFAAELAGMANVSGSSPGAAFTGQLTVSLGLRDHVHPEAPSTPTYRPRHRPRGL